MFRSERGLYPRNRILGGGSEGGRCPPPSFLAREGLLLPELPRAADGVRDRGLGPLRLLGIEIDDGAAEGHGLGLQAGVHLGVDGAEYTLGQTASDGDRAVASHEDNRGRAE